MHVFHVLLLGGELLGTYQGDVGNPFTQMEICGHPKVLVGILPVDELKCL